MAIVAADTTGRRADRIESLLSARLFVEPQLADDRITFVSNLSGHLSLYAMDASGGVPEPLLPPQMALQNPELVGGELFHVLPALGQILVMIDADGDENYVPHVIPLDGGFPEPLADEPFSGGRSHLVHVDDDAEIAYFAVESREEASITAVRVHLPTRAAEELWQSSYGAMVAAWTPDHSRVVLVDGYTMGDTVLYEIDDAGTRRMLYGAPIEERDPEAQQPLAGFRSGYGTASGAGVLLASTLHDDTGSLAYLDLSRPGDVDPVAIDGLAHEGVGELEGLDHLERDRYALTYNIDGCSWVYAGAFDEASRSFSVERVLVGEGELAGGVLHGLHHDAGSGRFVAAFCTATSPDPAPSAAGRRRVTCDVDARARARTCAGSALGWRGRIVRVARRAARVGSALPPVVRARLRGRRGRSSTTSTAGPRARNGRTSRGSRCRSSRSSRSRGSPCSSRTLADRLATGSTTRSVSIATGVGWTGSTTSTP